MTTGESQAPPPAIGIDLGTKYSCAAVWRKHRVEIIPNDQGNRITPSCVSFKGYEYLVGDSAINAAASNPVNTVFDVKRLIGRRFSDPLVKKDVMLWSFKVVRGRDDKPMIAITGADEEKWFSPEDISAIILLKMKEIAEAYLGSSINDVVITVPTYFSLSQRRATKEAGSLSGLNVLRIISEPTAAAIAYSLEKDRPAHGERNVLIFDLGGGTLDVSLLTMSECDVKVKAIAGDAHLGGEDFDYRMVNYFVEDLKRKHDKDISITPRALRRLKAACERAKRCLSFAERAVIEIDALHDGVDFEYEMSRAEFEWLNADFFEKCIRHVVKCLDDAKMDKSSVHDVVLAGGSTRIPKVQRLLRDFFDGKELCKSVHPDEAVASGAAFQAWAISSGQCGHRAIEDLTFRDVTPLSLGVGVFAGEVVPVVPKNTAFPTKVEEVWRTCADDQTCAAFEFYVGEGIRTQDNAYLGELTVYDIPRAPRGVEKLVVCFDIDADGFLVVSVVIRSTGDRRSLEIGYVDVPKNEVDGMLEDAERCKSEDKRHRRRFKAGRSLVRYVYKTRDTVLGKRGAPFKLPDLATKKIREEIDSSIEWLEANEFAEAKVLSKKRKELESKWNPFLDALSSLFTY